MSNPLELLQKKYSQAECVRQAEENPVDGRAVDSQDYGISGVRPDDASWCNVVFGDDSYGWRGCASIVLFKSFLEDHPGLGASIGLDTNDVLTMRFRPGLDLNDNERVHAASVALEMLIDAKDDIHRMIAAGGMRLRRF